MYFLVFLTILQIFSLEVTLIRDYGWINVSAYDPIIFVVFFLLEVWVQKLNLNYTNWLT